MFTMIMNMMTNSYARLLKIAIGF